jgi:predicted GNAT family N-acyltransferase
MQLGDNSEFTPRDEDLERFRSIHDKIFPADVRASERIVARIRRRKVDQNDSFEEMRVWRLSPLGIELLAPTGSVPFEKGDAIDLEVVVVGHRSYFEGLIVDIVDIRGDKSIYGLRLSRREESSSGTRERRQSNRWICSEEFLPGAVAPVPGRFDEFMHFKVRDISKDGLQLSTSLRNKFLLQGMSLPLSVSFPMGSVVQINVEIVRVGLQRFGSEDRIVLGTRFDKISEMARKVLGQYLIQFSNAESLSSVRTAGFSPESIASGTKFYYLKSEDDYRKVLQLRLEANQHAGQLGDISRAEDTGDMNDMRGRILVATRNDKVIGTARFRFPNQDEPLECESYLNWSNTLPRRDELIEVSRLATDRNFRASDLLAGMFKYACSTCITPERPWLVMSCMEKYKPFYEKIGFADTGLLYSDPHWSSPLHIMISDSYGVIKGLNVNPLYWNLIWKDVAEFMADNDLADFTSRDRARVFAYKLFSPIAFLLVNVLRKRRKN